jgi:tRNA-dihydrouridine synthase
MTKSNRLFEILDAMTAQLPSRSVTIKIRTGWNEKAPIAHELIPQIQRRFNSNLSAIMVCNLPISTTEVCLFTVLMTCHFLRV